MAAGLVYSNMTTAAGVTFTIARWVPDTSVPLVNAIPVHALVDVNGVPVTVKPASTAPLATDPAFVVAMSPNGQNTNGRKDPVNAAPIVASLSTDMTSSRVNAAATTNATSLKASAGSILNIAVFNAATYDVFVKFYNKASAPTVGTDTPVWTIPLKAGTGFFGPFPSGTFFATGIAYAITKLQADSDTTVLVAGDVTGKIDWV